jgi:hypothetical protein
MQVVGREIFTHTCFFNFELLYLHHILFNSSNTQQMSGDLAKLPVVVLKHISSWMTIGDWFATATVSTEWQNTPKSPPAAVGATVISLTSTLGRAITNGLVDTTRITKLNILPSPSRTEDVNELIVNVTHAMQGLRALQIIEGFHLNPLTLNHIATELQDLEELHIIDTDGPWTEGLHYLQQLPKLRIVILSTKGGSAPFRVHGLQHSKGITHLDLCDSFQKIQDIDLVWIATLPNLRVLRVDYTYITTTGVQEFQTQNRNCEVTWGRDVNLQTPTRPWPPNFTFQGDKETQTHIHDRLIRQRRGWYKRYHT